MLLFSLHLVFGFCEKQFRKIFVLKIDIDNVILVINLKKWFFQQKKLKLNMFSQMQLHDTKIIRIFFLYIIRAGMPS